MSATSSAFNAPSGGSSIGLFTNQIIKFVMLFLGCIFSIYIGVQVTDSDANGISIFMRYVAGGAFIAAVISPRVGIYLVLCMCPVLDLIKRALILFDAVNMFDVASVLAVAPVTMAGAVLGTFSTRIVFRHKASIPGERTLFLIMLAIVSMVVISGVMHNDGSTLGLLRDLAESCIYLCMILLIPVYFPTTENIATLLRWCIIVFLPVALYGFWQKAFGLTAFEERYLLSGLTVTTDDFMNSARIFSTLNSNHSFSVTMACCAVISLMQRQLPAASKWQLFFQRRAWWFFALFTLATVFSLRRTGWLVIGVSLAGAVCFRTRMRTLIFYSFCFVSALMIILNAETIFTKLPQWENSLQSAIPGYDQAFQLQTFNDRLEGFQSLRNNPAIWSAFGLSNEEKSSIPSHDAISSTLMSYGVVGMLAFLAVLIAILSVSHRLVWRATTSVDRLYAALLLSFIFANLFVGAIMQSHIGIFPVNFLFWLCAGALLKITFNQQPIVQAKPKLDLAALAAALKAKAAPPSIGRFSLPGR